MHSIMLIYKADRKVTVSITNVTSVTESTDNVAVVAGGVTITFSLSNWDYMETQYKSTT